jgi:cytochrome d ubiquinol oxidase subunit I
VFKKRMPKSKLFLWLAAFAGVLSVVAMEAGWVVTEVGRQPWIVRNYMRVEDAATGNTGVWITFFAVLGIYIGLGVTLILVLRLMSRRWREGDAPAEVDEGGPYGPRPTPEPEQEPEKESVP